MSEEALFVENLHKSYWDEQQRETPVLRGVDFTVRTGEILAIIGSSGSGKSTLLHAIGGLDAFDSGTVRIAGKSIAGLNETECGELRNRHLGFVYQFHHLQPEFTAIENVAMPLFIRGESRVKALEAAKAALEGVGLSDRLDHLPSQLSGGERQRTAIARAIVTRPSCVLADEPTGNLDETTAKSVFQRFVALAKESGTAIVIVTHDKSIAAACDRTIRLEQGRIQAV